MKHTITHPQLNAKNCFVCGVDNPLGLRARFYETAEGALIALFTPARQFQSYPNTLHGGISAALLDETIGRAIACGAPEMIWGVTLDLQVKYRRPVPYGVELKALARVTADRGRFFEGEGTLCLPTGETAVEARGVYMKRSIEELGGPDFAAREWGFAPDEPTPEWIEI